MLVIPLAMSIGSCSRANIQPSSPETLMTSMRTPTDVPAITTSL